MKLNKFGSICNIKPDSLIHLSWSVPFLHDFILRCSIINGLEINLSNLKKWFIVL